MTKEVNIIYDYFTEHPPCEFCGWLSKPACFKDCSAHDEYLKAYNAVMTLRENIKIIYGLDKN